jgi:hypothetical protein
MTVLFFGKVRTHKGYDYFAVRVCLELDIWTEGGAESNVVIDFAIDSENDLFILTNEGLGTSVYARRAQ